MSSFFLQNQWVISWKQRFSRPQNALKNNSQGIFLWLLRFSLKQLVLKACFTS